MSATEAGARSKLRWPALLLVAGLLGGPAANSTSAQGVGLDRTVPPMTYYNAFNLLYDGDYELALKAFEADSRSSIKTAQSRWIDSICYETMCGECYFQMGMFDEALQHYTAALQLFKTFPDWMMKVQFAADDPRRRGGRAEDRPLGHDHAAIPVGHLSSHGVDRSKGRST